MNDASGRQVGKQERELRRTQRTISRNLRAARVLKAWLSVGA